MPELTPTNLMVLAPLYGENIEITILEAIKKTQQGLIDSLKKELERGTAELKRADAEVRRADADLATANNRIAYYESELEKQDKEIITLVSENTERKAQTASATMMVGTLIMKLAAQRAA